MPPAAPGPAGAHDTELTAIQAARMRMAGSRGWVPLSAAIAVMTGRTHVGTEVEMAQKVTVALEDDLDGGPADETMRFGSRTRHMRSI